MILTLKQPLAFAILMQNILTKSPSYILEKFESCLNLEEPEVLLDSFNLRLFNEYLEKWKRKEQGNEKEK